ncbi:hypothetical protein [Metabacillus fastidiosus]|uniref:hypothetical protein n=1 Tax=Metabacillus fastidiosus TaxID=1458 RepID=UPI002E239AFB|nr:hypothetical protein [Metabacillus fastidiosus]
MKKVLKITSAAAAVAIVGTSLIIPDNTSAAGVTLGKVDFGGTLGSVDYSTLNRLQAFPSHADFGKYFNTNGSLKVTPKSIELDGAAYDYIQINRGLTLGRTLEQLKSTLTPVGETPTSEDLEVEEVAAITDKEGLATIADRKLSFTI